MNKRDIFLDFTSLLDVTLIILFFFILFSHFETEQAKTSLAQAQSQADVKSEEAERSLENAKILQNKAEENEKTASELLAEAELAGQRQGENVEGIMNFSSSMNLRIRLTVNSSDEWVLEIYKGNEKLDQIAMQDSEKLYNSFSSAINDSGSEKSDTVLCEFIYDASKPGTTAKYKEVSKMIDMIKTEYPHFYYSEIDTSVFEEG